MPIEKIKNEYTIDKSVIKSKYLRYMVYDLLQLMHTAMFDDFTTKMNLNTLK